ncbi:MAG: helical backbone metal receptor [Chloroflexota bacterium]
MPVLKNLRDFTTFPERVVSLVPSMTESLFDLGMGDHLVGVTEYCVHPEQAKLLPKVGGTKDVQISRVIELNPDLVIANQEENTQMIVETLGQHLNVWLTFPKTVRQALDDLWQLVHLFHQERAFLSLRTLETAVEYAENRLFDFQPQRVFVPIWQDQLLSGEYWWMTFNQDTYCNDVIRLLGGVNVFAERQRRYSLLADLSVGTESPSNDRDTRYPRVIKEEVITAQPEIILLPDEPYAFNENDVERMREFFQETPAVKKERIFRIDGSLLTWHGTRLAKALTELSQYFG